MANVLHLQRSTKISYMIEPKTTEGPINTRTTPGSPEGGELKISGK